MDSVVVELLRQVRDELACLRRETADRGIEADDRLARIEAALTASPRAAPNEAGEQLLVAIAAKFREREFLAVELMAWCSPCVDQRQRDAYRAICALCEDDNPTPRQLGMVLRDLADHPPPGTLRIECTGDRRGSALWSVRE